jgi:hypothetical protein
VFVWRLGIITVIAPRLPILEAAMSKTPGPASKSTPAPPAPSPAAPAPPPVEPETLNLRFLRPTATADGELVTPGEFRRLPLEEAKRHIGAGRAVKDAVKIRILFDNINVDNVIYQAGDIVETTEGIALAKYRQSAVELVDPWSIPPGRLPVQEPRPKRPEPRDPYEGEARIKIKATDTVCIPGGSLSAGEEATVPESAACRAVASGKATFVDLLDRLSDQGRKWLEALLKNPTAPAPAGELWATPSHYRRP